MEMVMKSMETTMESMEMTLVALPHPGRLLEQKLLSPKIVGGCGRAAELFLEKCRLI
jgi:hypothetical protein